MLPAYQIQQFIDKTKSTHYRYTCQNCVEVKPVLSALIPSRRAQSSLKLEQEVENLRRELEACKGLLKQNEVDRVTIASQKKELANLRKNLNEDPGFHTIEYVEQKFEEKLESLKPTIKEMIEQTIKTECKALSEKTYASVTSSNTTNLATPNQDSLKEVIKDAWREEGAEEADKRRRAPNVIVHGLPEKDEENDKSWASDFIKDTHARANIQRVRRLGVADGNKKRPLLLSLKNEQEKWTVIGNLTSLKGLENYKGISITEDLTPAQRKVYKELSNDAKKLNSEEKSQTEIYRVRGDTKNGFAVKKLKIKKQQ